MVSEVKEGAGNDFNTAEYGFSQRILCFSVEYEEYTNLLVYITWKCIKIEHSRMKYAENDHGTSRTSKWSKYEIYGPY